MIASFLLFLQLISSLLGSVHQEAFNSLKMDGKTAAAVGKRLVPSCKPCLAVALLQKHENLSRPFAEHGHTPCYNLQKRSAPPPVNQGASGYDGCWEPLRCPNFSYLIKVFSCAGLVESTAMSKEHPSLFGSSVRVAQTMSSTAPLHNQAILSLPSYQYSQMFNEPRCKKWSYY